MTLVSGAADSLRHPWYRLQHGLLQFAGGQGMVAAGAGYSLVRRRLDLDLLAGYVPRRYSTTALGIFTAKLTYSPWLLPLGPGSWQLQPLSFGAQLNHTAGSGLNASRDAKYPRGYYWWSARTRLGAFVGGRLRTVVRLGAARPPHKLALYYELGTNDLYLASWWNNRGALGLPDILTLGLGIKWNL
jgi:hypothetical protein